MPTKPANVRAELLEAGARLLGEEGPGGLSARRLAAETGTSTMAVYTQFGGMPGFVHAIAAEGFTRLAAAMTAVPTTDEPLLDLRGLGEAYHRNALDNPHLYAVMFGTASLGTYRTSDKPEVGHYTFDVLVAGVQRVIDAGTFAPAAADDLAAQLWSALHGFVMLEFAGLHRPPEGAENRVLWPLLNNLVLSFMRS